MIEFRALGSLAVVIDGEEVSVGGPRQRRLLAMLLVHRDDVVSVDRLAEAVFAGEPTPAARTTMRSYVARIRRVIGETPAASLLTQAPGYALRVAPESFDVARFEQQLEAGRRQVAAGDAALAVGTLRSALAIWSGSAYAELADEEWVFLEAQRLEELRLSALERLVDAELACGRASETVALLESLVVDHPLREAFRGQQMLALYRAGRQVDALRAYRSYRETLADELGLEPSPALAELERRILEHDGTLDLAEAAGEPLRGYRLGRRVGAGPNGTMFVATVAGGLDERTISILTDPRVDDPGFVRSFETNAQTIASLTHPAVVALHDYWRQPGTAYLVARRPAGATLRERLEAAPLQREELVALATRIGAALGAARARGVEHGWITLDNIVDDDGWALTNFVVCPRTPGSDTADLATVLDACVHRLQPPLPAAAQHELDAVLAARGVAVDELVASFVRVLSGAAEPSAGARPNPFKGLRAFDETDADDFHGRGTLVAELLDRICAHTAGGLTLVVGGSGSGKSSVVRAGVIPAVRRGALGESGAWYVTTMLPGSAPFKELAEAMRRISITELDRLDDELRDGSSTLDEVARTVLPPGGRLLLVVDQFEELFTLAPEDDQLAFAELIADAAESGTRVHVLATLRADFYDRPLAVRRLGGLVGPATVVVPAMSPTDLEAAIVRPVEALGATAEPALVAELVAATTDQAGALPALQFTLFELAERTPDRSLTMEEYRRLGGLDQAIASRAETLYRSLDQRGRDVVRSVFERLVVIDPDAEPTGRRSARADLAVGDDAHAVQEMIEQWAAARLLSGDHDPRTRVPTVQLAHEALLRSWPRLRQWIDDDRDVIAEAHRRREATTEWLRVGRDEGALFRGARLDTALELVGPERDRLPDAEREFLDASESLRRREETEAANRLAAQERANRRLRIQVVVIAIALVGALVVGFLAVDQRNAADAARRDARARQLASAAEANVDADPERAIHLALLAVESARSDGSALPEALDALHHAVTGSRVLLTIPDVGGKVAWDPRGDRFVTEGPEESGILDIRDANTGESIRSWRADEIDINEVRYSRDGSMLAVAGDDGILKIFDPDTGELLASLEGTGPIWDVSFDAKGEIVLAQWSREAKIRGLNLATGGVREVDGVATQLEISPDGTRVVVAGDSGVALLDTETLEELFFTELPEPSQVARWRPDGSRIAVGGAGGTVRVLDGETGHVVTASAAHSAMVNVVEWNRFGTGLATGGYDGVVRVWGFDHAGLVERHRLRAQEFTNGVAGLAFSADGTRLAVGEWTIAATKIFDLRPTAGGELAAFMADPELGVRFSGDEITTAVGVAPGRPLQVVDATTGEVIRTLDEIEPWWPGFAFDPSGSKLAWVPGGEREFHVHDVTGDGPRAEFSVEAPGVGAVAWDHTGAHLAYTTATQSVASRVTVVDTAGNALATYRTDDVLILPISFSRDGTYLAFTTSRFDRADPELDAFHIWDWRRDEIVHSVSGRFGRVLFDPSGRYLAVTRINDGRVEVYDAETFAPHVTLPVSTPQTSLAFDRTGSRLATGGNDGVARVWDLATGEQVTQLHAPGTVFGLAFDDTGDRLVSIDTTYTALVWALDSDTLVEIARSRVTRELTEEECARHLNAACPAPVADT